MFTAHHVSHVRCHMSRVMCQVSRVRCHVSHFFLFLLFFLFFFLKSGWTSQWMVCYQRGLPRLVYLFLPKPDDDFSWMPFTSKLLKLIFFFDEEIVPEKKFLGKSWIQKIQALTVNVQFLCLKINKDWGKMSTENNLNIPDFCVGFKNKVTQRGKPIYEINTNVYLTDPV